LRLDKAIEFIFISIYAHLHHTDRASVIWYDLM
jgi:hypothetical protein